MLWNTSDFEWYKQFKEEWENVHDNTRNGQHKTQRIDTNMDRMRIFEH